LNSFCLLRPCRLHKRPSAACLPSHHPTHAALSPNQLHGDDSHTNMPGAAAAPPRLVRAASVRMCADVHTRFTSRLPGPPVHRIAARFSFVQFQLSGKLSGSKSTSFCSMFRNQVTTTAASPRIFVLELCCLTIACSTTPTLPFGPLKGACIKLSTPWRP
jgi:hypothetical protein